MENKDIGEICKNNNLKGLICVPIYHKNPNNSSDIDLIRINSQRSLQSLCVIEIIKRNVDVIKVDEPVIRRDLVLAIFRSQFVLYKSFSNYFQILTFILVERAECWEHLGVICFW